MWKSLLFFFMVNGLWIELKYDMVKNTRVVSTHVPTSALKVQVSVKWRLQCKAPLTHVIAIIPNGGDSASGDMWQCLGALFLVTVGCRKLLLSSEQKLGLLSNILQDTDHFPMATNYPVHDVSCADIEKFFLVKDDFYILWQKMHNIFVREKAGQFYLHFASWKTKTLRCGNGATSPDWWFINFPLFAHITLWYDVSLGTSTSALEGGKSYPNAHAIAFPDFVSRRGSAIMYLPPRNQEAPPKCHSKACSCLIFGKM